MPDALELHERIRALKSATNHFLKNDFHRMNNKKHNMIQKKAHPDISVKH